MKTVYKPEGTLIDTAGNDEYLASAGGLERAMLSGAIIEGMVTLCDKDLCLHVDLRCAEGIIPPDEAVYCRAGEGRKDIAILSRVAKPVACRVLSVGWENGRRVALLSRRLAQKECLDALLRENRPGDLLWARVTHLEPFGAFVDVGCGVSSLLSVDCISVSRISHPRDRLSPGMLLPVVIKSVAPESERLYVTLRELLGTWEENASRFRVGETVTGIIRSVESYGVFIELAPNLAGLSEVREELADTLRAKIGKPVAVYIKSILPYRMKLKLVLIDTDCRVPKPEPLRFSHTPDDLVHLSEWRYSPAGCPKIVETVFDPPQI